MILRSATRSRRVEENYLKCTSSNNDITEDCADVTVLERTYTRAQQSQ